MRKTVHGATVWPADVGNNVRMLEILVIALLFWLWVIERRLSALNAALKSVQLDVDGLRAMRAPAAVTAGAARAEAPPGLPEVTSLHESKRKASSS